MAVQLEFINLIVPIETIKAKYPGSWEACLADHKDAIGGRIWFDDHLFRDGAMNPMDMQFLVTCWESMGFETKREVDGTIVWQDVCVTDFINGNSRPCDWLLHMDTEDAVYLKGTEPGPVIGREQFKRAHKGPI
jgi:hypothetical protein